LVHYIGLRKTGKVYFEKKLKSFKYSVYLIFLFDIFLPVILFSLINFVKVRLFDLISLAE